MPPAFRLGAFFAFFGLFTLTFTLTFIPNLTCRDYAREKNQFNGIDHLGQHCCKMKFGINRRNWGLLNNMKILVLGEKLFISET